MKPLPELQLKPLIFFGLWRESTFDARTKTHVIRVTVHEKTINERKVDLCLIELETLDEKRRAAQQNLE